MTAFLIWCATAAVFCGLGIFCFFAKKPVSFYANVKPFPVSDVRGYNRACGWLWIGYSVGFALLGLPLLGCQNNALVLLSVVGAMIEVLALILIYILVIEKKYRKK